MTLNDILRTKGSTVYTIAPTATLGDVVRSLMAHRCGALLVCADPNCARGMIGIISERDLLRACAEHEGSIGALPVTDYMTMDLVTGSPDDSIEHTMATMTDNRIRHLPVLDHDRLAGMISIGDLVKSQLNQTVIENHYLKTYIHG